MTPGLNVNSQESSFRKFSINVEIKQFMMRKEKMRDLFTLNMEDSSGKQTAEGEHQNCVPRLAWGHHQSGETLLLPLVLV